MSAAEAPRGETAPEATDGVRTVRLGVLGCGTVGGALVSLCQTDADHIATTTGIRLQVSRVAVRNLTAQRSVELHPGVLTRDVEALVVANDVDVVVETIGGIEPARHLVAAALRAGKPVVTANKELIANCGEELFAEAETAGVDLLFEAAVAGGIPLIGVLRRSLAGERISRVMGIVNGTTNFILTKMTDEGADYADVLTEAQRLGYAEADPSADVEGFDAGAKAAILAMLAFGAKVVAGDVYREGISGLRGADIDAARRMGHVIKLLAVAERVNGAAGGEADAESTAAGEAGANSTAAGEAGARDTAAGEAGANSTAAGVSVRVHPAMVPTDHPLGSVRDSFNAVFLQGPAIDDVMLYGRGAGGAPTASAVLGDVLTASRNLAAGVTEAPIRLAPVRVHAIDESSSAYHLSMEVIDAPGVLAAVAGVFGNNDVSIRSMEQSMESAAGTDGAGPTAHLEFITHRAREADVQATLTQLRDLPQVRSVGLPIRVIGD